MKIALIYDWIATWGGAERVLLSLHEMFPKADWYTAYYDKKNAPWAEDFTIHTSFIQKIPINPYRIRWLTAPLFPFAFESFKYYLMVSRLESYKNVDLVVSLFKQLNKKLIIIGTGSQENRLKSIASANITFFNRLSDQQLGQLYTHAQALIMPQEEDFGYPALEAQFFGCPVISYRKSGASESIIEDRTGIFF